VTSRVYRDQDYIFGEAILALRVKIGLTQAGLAKILGVSRRTVVGWESGNSYPKTEHLKNLISFSIKQHAFTAGKEADKIREFWQIAHQKVLIDEDWLAGLLLHTTPSGVEQTHKIIGHTVHLASDSVIESPRVDWGDALAVPTFYGREWELNLLTGWILEERCRVVSIVGLGGIGKSSLSINVMHQVASDFQVVIWRSLRDAPPCEALFEDLVRAFVPQAQQESNENVERPQKILLKELRGKRVLLVLDNLETILEEGALEGHILAGYEAFRQFLRQLAETEHHSCVVLTSREKLIDLVPAEGNGAPVRTLRLARLHADACIKLLTERQLRGSAENQMHLIDAYAGNPLAIKIVAQTISDLFGGEIAAFLDQGDIIFGDVRALLDEQFARLSPLEQNIVVWLAIMREPSSLGELLSVMVTPVSRVDLLEAILSLHRRSLIEQGQLKGSFTLQSVVLEYGTSRLIAILRAEIETGTLVRLLEHGLVLAHAREYVRQTQERLVAAPILTLLENTYLDQTEMERHLLTLLAQFRSRPSNSQGYGPGNLVTLLRLLRGDLRGLDLSHLALRGVYLQCIQMQDTNLQNTSIHDGVFSESFETLSSLSISGTGEYWATGSWGGEIHVYTAEDRVLYRLWQTAVVTRIALSPDGRLLAGGSANGEINVWEVASGALMWSSGPGMSLGHSTQLVFSPDGRILATASNTGLRLWNAGEGTLLATLPQSQPVASIAWKSDRAVLASGDTVGRIRYWAIHRDAPADLLMTVQAHDKVVTGVAFSPLGDSLVSGSWDGTVKVWNATNGNLQETLARHQDWVERVAWSGDGRVIAYSVRNEASWLWDVEEHRHRAALRGHTTFVRGLLFTPDNRHLVSASEDGTMRVWEVATGTCIHIMYGYAARVHDMSWSPDGSHLVSVESTPDLTVYPLNNALPIITLRGHTDLPYGVRWSPDGLFIASNSVGNAIRLWDGKTGKTLESLTYPDDPGNSFSGLAWSHDGGCLATGTAQHGIQLFDMTTRSARSMANGQTLISGYAMRWSPNGAMLAASCEDDTIGVWNTDSGEPLLRVLGERWCLAWSSDSTRLALFESRSEDSELLLWDIERKERIPLALHPGIVVEIAWMENDTLLITAGSDGRLRWWEVNTGNCVLQIQAYPGKINTMKLSPDETMLASSGEDGGIMIHDVHSGALLKTLRRDRPYERLNITGVKGLTEAQIATLRALGAIEKTQHG
jgi:WD40 repeat protein/transcriptional regulator with XRE-family HTH domain